MPYTVQDLEDAIRANAGNDEVVVRLAEEREKLLGGQKEQQQSDLVNYGPGFAKETLKSAGKGLAGLFSTPGNIGSMLPEGAQSPLTGGLKSWPTTEQTLGFLKGMGIDLEGEKHVPGSPEATWDKAVEFGAGSLPGAVANLPFRVASGMGAGAVGEQASGLANKKEGNQAARLLAEIATLVGPTALMARVPNTFRKAGSELIEQGEGKIREAAEAAKAFGAKLGAKFNLGQGLKEGESALGALIEDLLTTRSGMKGRQQMTEQSAKAADEARLLVEKQSTLPGTQETANRVGKSWETAEKAPTEGRSDLTRDLYKSADQLSPHGWLDDILFAIREKKNEMGWSDSSKKGREFAKLTKKLEAEDIPGPVTPRTTTISDLIREVTTEASELEARGKGVKAMGKRISGSSAMNEAEAGFDPLKIANQAHRDFSGPVDEMAASVMPKIHEPGQAPKLDQFGKVLSEHPTDIAFTARKLGNNDPEALGAIIKSTWGKKLADAMEGGGGQTKPTGPSEFVDAIFSGKNGKESARVALEANAAAKGHPDPAAAAKDAIELLEAIQATGRTRGYQGQFPKAESQAGGQANPLSPALSAVSFKPFLSAADAIAGAVGKRTNDKLMEMIMNPQKVEELIALLRNTPGEVRGKALIGALSGLMSGGFDKN